MITSLRVFFDHIVKFPEQLDETFFVFVHSSEIYPRSSVATSCKIFHDCITDDNNKNGKIPYSVK